MLNLCIQLINLLSNTKLIQKILYIKHRHGYLEYYYPLFHLLRHIHTLTLSIFKLKMKTKI